MMIGVTLEGALKSGKIAVVPLDTDYVKPELEDIKSFCMSNLSSFYPEDEPTGTCDIPEVEWVCCKIKAAQSIS